MNGGRKLMIAVGLSCLAVGAMAADIGMIAGKQLKIGSDEVKVLVDPNSHFNLANVGVKAGDSCQQASPGALVLSNDQRPLPLVCYDGKWHKITPLSAINEVVDNCGDNSFLTVKNGTLKCQPVAVSNNTNVTYNTNVVANDDIENLSCYKSWVKLQSPYSIDCPMAYSQNLTAANDFKSMGTKFDNYKFSLSQWAKNGKLSVGDDVIRPALANDGNKGRYEKVYEIDPAKTQFPYAVLARLENGVNVGKTLTLKTSDENRRIVLGSEANHYSMFIISREGTEGNYRYSILAAYFRDTSTDDEFKEGYYHKIRLKDGEVPKSIKVEYEWTGNGVINNMGKDSGLIFEFQGA